MKRTISKALLRLTGWRLGPVIQEDVPKCVICVAPHTSNWDFVFGKLLYTSIGRNARFLIKKEWFIFPFNLLFKKLGGVPIDRSKNTSVTDQMAEQFNSHEKFQLAITPEGTRKRVEEWNLLAYLDYKKKEAGISKLFYPTGDVERDIRQIRAYYKEVTACHPHNFVSI